MTLGDVVGVTEVDIVGETEGLELGLGVKEGEGLGVTDGLTLGLIVGVTEGDAVGETEGLELGLGLGLGLELGLGLGVRLGEGEGDGVGESITQHASMAADTSPELGLVNEKVKGKYGAMGLI